METIDITFTDEEMKLIEDYSKKNNLTVEELIHKILREYMLNVNKD